MSTSILRVNIKKNNKKHSALYISYAIKLIPFGKQFLGFFKMDLDENVRQKYSIKRESTNRKKNYKEWSNYKKHQVSIFKFKLENETA